MAAPTAEWCDAIINKALALGEAELALGYANQNEVDAAREALQAAALRQAEPMEILTLPMGMGPFAGVGLKVRRFAAPPLGTCREHKCLLNLPTTEPHIRYYDCQDWVKV